MFRGNKTVSLDSKGRISIPAHYRVRLLGSSGGKVVVTPNFRFACLDIYPLSEWEGVEEQIGKLAGSQQAKLRRVVIGRSLECELDGSGRILLSQELRDHANLERITVLAGVGFKMELWDEGAWSRISQPEELSEEDLSLLQDVYF